MGNNIGFLTGGGDCPGLNAVIRAAVKKCEVEGYSCIGFLEGWRGIIEGKTMELNSLDISEIVGEGGTILGSSRTNPYKDPNDHTPVDKIIENFKKFDLEALIAIGGDDTLGVANKLYKNENLNVIGVPKTIDNDLSATDYTFGFDTAVNNAMVEIDKLKTTARSHRRCIVVEVMGRHAGWIAAYAGMATGADITLVPEKPVNLEHVIEILKRNRERGKLYNIVVVSEGATFEANDFVTKDTELDEFGHVKLGGIAKTLAKLIQKHTDIETRSVVLGHTQRGGAPSAFDRILGTRYGYAAASLVTKKAYGQMVALRGNEIVGIPLEEAVSETKTLDLNFFSIGEMFFEN